MNLKVLFHITHMKGDFVAKKTLDTFVFLQFAAVLADIFFKIKFTWNVIAGSLTEELNNKNNKTKTFAYPMHIQTLECIINSTFY